MSEQSLAAIADQIDLGRHLNLGKGEESSGGRTRPSILADAVESVLAAAFLDGGMEAARAFVERFVLPRVPVRKRSNEDYKTVLEELVQQQKNQQLQYLLVGESGPDHDKHFEVKLTLNGAVIGRGTGSSKKRAEQAAAHAALRAMGR